MTTSQQATDARRDQRRRRAGALARMDCQCWCEAGQVKHGVLASDIVQGLTSHCYRERCKEMDRFARKEHQRRQSA